jgi:hypothetical protein
MKAPNPLKTPSIYFTIRKGDGKKPNMGGFRSVKSARKPSACIVTRYLNGVAIQASVA